MFHCTYPKPSEMSTLEAVSRVRATLLEEFRGLEDEKEANRREILSVYARLEQEIQRLQQEAAARLRELSNQQETVALKQDAVRESLAKIGVYRVPNT